MKPLQFCPSSIGGNPNPGGTINLNAQQEAYVRDGTNAGTAFGSTDAANHKTIFNANRLSAGVYTLKLLYNGKIITRNLLKN